MPYQCHIRVPLGAGGELVEATFLARPNRFLVEACLDGRVVRAHLADRGRLAETLVPGARLLLARREGHGRATAFQAVAAIRETGDRGRAVGEGAGRARGHSFLMGLDTHLPNRLIEAALRAGALPAFAGYTAIRREARIGESRFDFLLEADGGRCVLEVKSAGYVADGLALFPDAPTERGRRHLRELAALAARGARAAVLFVAQGGDARAVTVNRAIDPAFAEELRQAVAGGVETHAHACPLTRAGLALGPAVPVLL